MAVNSACAQWGGFRCAQIGGGWHRELELGCLEVGISCGWFGEHIWLSLVGPELEARANKKNKKADNHCPILIIWGQALQSVWVRVLLLYVVWPMSVCILCAPGKETERRGRQVREKEQLWE